LWESNQLKLSGGQSVTGRLWDLLFLLSVASRAQPDSDRVHFQVSVDTKGDGNLSLVRLWALIGPGDTLAPVITVMLEGED